MTSEAKNKMTEQTEITKKTESLRSFRYFRLFRHLQIVFVSVVLSLAANAQQAQASEDGAKLKLGNRTLLENSKDGFMAVHKVRYSPDGKRFLVIACGFECNDNIGFLFNADGSGKRKFTTRWANGRKSEASSRTLKPDARYAVFRISATDSLNVRQAPGVKAKSIGSLPPDASDIRFIGERRKLGKEIWVKITSNKLTGWVNQSFLYEAH